MLGFTSRQPSVVDTSVWSVRGKPFSGFWTTQGARLIDSTPPEMQIDASPTAIARLASTVASIPEPQRRLTVAPGTLVGRPASRDAIRATSRFSSPAPLELPKNTSSIRSWSRLGLRSVSAPTTIAARSSGRTPASAPPYRPVRVRTASTM
jgi:hypothetical protein